MGGQKCRKCKSAKVGWPGMACTPCIPSLTTEEKEKHDASREKLLANRTKNRKKPERKQQEANYKATVRAAKLAVGECQIGGCTEPAMEGYVRCEHHHEVNRAHGKKIAPIDKSSSDGLELVCKRRNCGELCYDIYNMCEAHYIEDNEKMYRAGREWRSREESADKLAMQRETQKKNKHNIGEMSLSLFQALDMKRDYLRKILASIDLPDEKALYMDSETRARSIGDGNAAENVFEWTVLTYKKGKPIFFQRKTDGSKAVSEQTLERWAEEIGDLVHGKLVVQYGISKPETNRMTNLFTYLDKDDEMPKYRHFEPMTAVLSRIFSRDPRDEYNSKAGVYSENWALDALNRRFNRVYDADGKSYTTIDPHFDWKDWASWKNTDLKGKSVTDVVYLFNLIKALRLVKAGIPLYSNENVNAIPEDRGEGSSNGKRARTSL